MAAVEVAILLQPIRKHGNLVKKNSTISSNILFIEMVHVTNRQYKDF